MTTTTENLNRYEIGGVCVEMTEAQAARWNAGDTTEHDLDTVRASLPDRYEVLPSGNSGRMVEASSTITLRRATNESLSPETASMMDGMPANLIS